MQISGMSLALTWPCRLCLLRVLLGVSHCYKLSPFQHTGEGDTAPAFLDLHVYLQLTWEVGLVPSPVEFSSLCHSHKLSCSWFLGTRTHSCPLRPGLTCLFTVPEGTPLPPSSELRAPHPLCYISLLFLLLITQFLFFPCVGVGLSRGLC
jgi:hypothetical protein